MIYVKANDADASHQLLNSKARVAFYGSDDTPALSTELSLIGSPNPTSVFWVVGCFTPENGVGFVEELDVYTDTFPNGTITDMCSSFIPISFF